MKKASVIILLLVLGVCTYSQSTQGGSQFDAAVEAFESGEYEQTISLLAAYEKSHGTSPRLESLRALAYRDLEKPKEAHQAILVYLRLTARRDMSGSEAHQDMLKLRDEMLEAIEKKYKEDKEKLDKEREEVAASVIEELTVLYDSPSVRVSSSTALPGSVKKAVEDYSAGEYIGPPESAPKFPGSGPDAGAELEMWRKVSQSTVAMDYFVFIQTFPDGKFAETARKKMLEIGDPVWNELKKSSEPAKYIDYIKANPDSPFLETAKARFAAVAMAAMEWEKVRATGDTRSIMRFISANPSGLYAADAKAMIEGDLWAKISASPADDLLEFYVLHYPNTERSKEAASKLQASKAAQREAEFQGIRSRIAAQNDVKVTRQHTGYAPTVHWYQNKVLNVCTLETTEFDVQTYNRGLDYSSKSFRIDLKNVRRTYPGVANSWGFQIAVGGNASEYSSPNDYKFSGTGQYFTRKSTSKPFALKSTVPLSETYIVVLNTYDANIAATFAKDLNALVGMCKASK